MDMYFTGDHLALAHLSLPFGEAISTIEALVDQFQTVDDEADEESTPPPRITLLLGRTDLVVSFLTPSFRDLFKLNSQLGSSSYACRWVLSKRVVNTPPSSNDSDPPATNETPLFNQVADSEHEKTENHKPANSTCAYLHLRVNRELYVKQGPVIDTVVITRIEETTRRFCDICEIYAGLGWSDFIVYAGSPKQGDGWVEDLMAALQGSRFREHEAPLFSRTITLPGYDWDLNACGNQVETVLANSPSPDFRIRAPLFFFNVLPANVGTAENSLKTLLDSFSIPPDGRASDAQNDKGDGDTYYELFRTTGKFDLVASPRDKNLEIQDVFANPVLRQQLVNAGKSLGVLAIETSRHTPAHDDGSSNNPIQPQCQVCGCRKISEGILAESALLLEEHSPLPLPSGLAESLAASFSLLSSVLRNEERCCEMARIVVGCHASVRETLRELKTFQGQEVLLADSDERFAWIERCFKEIRIWCSRVEKILAERGETYQEVFERTAELRDFRGNVHKYLETADYLVQEFLALTRKHLGLSMIPSPVLHYGATDIIESELRSGVVTIPSKYLFSLPLSIPQLWQETGTRVFHHLYRFYEDRGDPNNLDNSPKSRERVESFLAAENAAASGKKPFTLYTKKEIIQQLADHYADLIVAHFGFRDFRQFSTYLVTLAVRAPANILGEANVRSAHWEAITQRLFFLRECEMLLLKRGIEFTENWTWPPGEVSKIPSSKNGDISGRSSYITSLILADVEAALSKTLRGEQRSRLAIPAEDILNNVAQDAAQRALREGYLKCHWQFMWDFIEKLETHRQDETYLEDDQSFKTDVYTIQNDFKVIDLSERPLLNPYFREGFRIEVEEHRLRRKQDQKPFNPAGMAALGRSVYATMLSRRGRSSVEDWEEMIGESPF